jgi:heat shock protein HslJ
MSSAFGRKVNPWSVAAASAVLLLLCGERGPAAEPAAPPTVTTPLQKALAVASADPEKAREGGPWLLLELNSAIVQLPAGVQQPYLQLQRQERRVTGYSGCNEFFGSFDLKGDALTFGPLGMTRRFCADASGEVEQVFLGVLSKVRGWRVERQMLLLMDGDQVLARLRQEHRSAQ